MVAGRQINYVLSPFHNKCSDTYYGSDEVYAFVKAPVCFNGLFKKENNFCEKK
jgi:hypothetical protein